MMANGGIDKPPGFEETTVGRSQEREDAEKNIRKIFMHTVGKEQMYIKVYDIAKCKVADGTYRADSKKSLKVDVFKQHLELWPYLINPEIDNKETQTICDAISTL